MMMKDPFVNDNFSGGHSSEPNKEKNRYLSNIALRTKVNFVTEKSHNWVINLSALTL